MIYDGIFCDLFLMWVSYTFLHGICFPLRLPGNRVLYTFLSLKCIKTPPLGVIPQTSALDDNESITYVRQDRKCENHKDTGMHQTNLWHCLHCIQSKMYGIPEEQWSRRWPTLLGWSCTVPEGTPTAWGAAVIEDDGVEWYIYIRTTYGSIRH